VTNQEQTNIARLLPLIALAQKALLQFDVIGLRWVPRHHNRDADRLSRAAHGLAA
jgi:ribonuclease HI